MQFNVLPKERQPLESITRTSSWRSTGNACYLVFIRPTAEEMQYNAMLAGPIGVIIEKILLRVQRLDHDVGELLFAPISSIENMKLIVDTFKPDRILFCSLPAAEVWFEHHGQLFDPRQFNRLHPVDGRLVAYTLDVARISESNDPKGSPNLLGQVLMGFTKLLIGHGPYDTVKLTKFDVPNIKVHTITTMEEFDSFYERLVKAKQVAIDSETTGLSRYDTKILTLQFAFKPKLNSKGRPIFEAFIVVLDHNEAPIKGNDREYMRAKLREYFETKRRTIHIYHNAKYDLTMLRLASLGVRFYANKVYDTLAGEFCLDENSKFLPFFDLNSKFLETCSILKKEGVTKYSPYSLECTALRYGCDIYANDSGIGFSKSDRKHMAEIPLAKFKLYAGIDAILTYLIFVVQNLEARRRDYQNFYHFITNQMSDTIHAMVSFEKNGIPVDAQYCYDLQRPDSEFRILFKEAKAKFYANEKVAAYNKRLSSGKATHTLFGDEVYGFDLSNQKQLKHFFFKELGLSPVSFTKKTGEPQLNKDFFKAYEDNEAVKAYSELVSLTTIKNSFVDVVFGYIDSHFECKHDKRLRPVLGFIDVVTGRTSSRNPNLQNQPSRGKLSKIIKRQFVASPCWILVDLDYSAHEIRMWGNISRDKKLKESLILGYWLRLKLRFQAHKNYKAYLSAIKALALKKEGNEVEVDALVDSICVIIKDLAGKGDPHVANVKFFFNKDVEKSDPLRTAVKTVVFGVIYGKGARSLAIELKNTEEFAQSLIDKLFSTMKQGGNYIKNTHNLGRKRLVIESALGAKRHLYGYLHHDRAVLSGMDRRGPNSEIQGMSSHIGMAAARLAEKTLWNLFGDTIQFKQVNFVHDSTKTECALHVAPIITYFFEHCYTTLMHKHLEDVYGFTLDIPLEIEFNIGFHQANMFTWDFMQRSLCMETKKLLPNHKMIHGVDIPPEMLKAFYHNASVIEALREREIKATLEANEELPRSIMFDGSVKRQLILEV